MTTPARYFKAEALDNETGAVVDTFHVMAPDPEAARVRAQRFLDRLRLRTTYDLGEVTEVSPN